MQSSWDVVVIGAGVAGLSAAVTVARGGLRCLCLDRMGPGGLLINLATLSDCPHLAPGSTGPDHVAALTDRALEAGVELGIGEVRALRPGEAWTVETETESFTARAVIIATGLANGRLGIDGELRFEGQGLSHCATCDGPLYAGAEVVVVGSDRWALQEALELAEVAAHVTLVTQDAALDSGEPRTARIAAQPNVTVSSARIVGIRGNEGVEAVVLEQAGKRTDLAARAVFPYIGRRPETGFAGGIVAYDEVMRIRVDENLRTGASCLFAAGDVRAGSAQSVSEAEEDGRRAGNAALQALAG